MHKANQLHMKKFETVDQYIANFPAEVQTILQELRRVIASAAPAAEECISYQMPTFRLHGNLVHFAGYSNHIGFYPAPSGISHFADRISAYKHAKGSLQFPLSKPIPFDLVADIVRFRAEENIRKATEKRKK